jgi:hypothetical protein
MEPVEGKLACRHEVDEARWVSLDEASRLLTYDRDIDLLRSLSALARARPRAG